jgi:hypothetical protein
MDSIRIYYMPLPALILRSYHSSEKIVWPPLYFLPPRQHCYLDGFTARERSFQARRLRYKDQRSTFGISEKEE